MPSLNTASAWNYILLRGDKRSICIQGRKSWVCIIFSAYYKLISKAFSRKKNIFSLKVCRHNIREVRGAEVLGPMGRVFVGWRDWVGRVGGWWYFRVGGVAENPIPKAHEFPSFPDLSNVASTDL